MPEVSTIRSALFVDFDNIFLNFHNQDQDLAKAFATRPERWLRWLVDSKLPLPGNGMERRILIRRCYLNPSSFADFRPYFTKAAFEVIDCPPLTSRGKTSTDVHMVMDILETLHHYPSIDEFIVLSGDADFTPVLIKLRKHDRRTSVLAVGYASPAYKASADHVFDLDDFISTGIGFVELEAAQEVPATAEVKTESSLIDRMARRVLEVVSESGPVQAADLPRIFREFKEFGRDTKWLGYGTLRRLAQEVANSGEGLVLLDEDPWKMGLQSPAAVDTTVIEQPAGAVQMSFTPDNRQRIEEFIVETVRNSPVPVVLAKMAHLLAMKFGSGLTESQWFGSGSFKSLLGQLNLPGIEMSSLLPGFLYDPSVHPAPEEKMDSLQVKIHNITDTPLLPTEHYQILFRCLANEVNANGYSLSRTSKAVRDCCAEDGATVARSHVNFVLLGLGHVRYRFQPGQVDAATLSQKFYENVLNLCRSSQISLSDEDTESVRSWITGKP